MPRPRLRPYQVRDLERIDAAIANGADRVLYQAPTGTGKTVVFAEFTRRKVTAGGSVVVLAHRDEIIEQISDALDALDIRHGIIAPSYPETRDRVQVASVMSLLRRLPRLRQRLGPTALIADEGHHAAAASWRKIFDQFPHALLLGVTATPRRLDGRPLDDIFDTLIVGPGIAWLTDRGYLAPATVFTPARSPDLSRVNIRTGDYAVEQLSAAMSNTMIVEGAVDEYERLCPNAPGIAFCVDIRHSKLVAEAFRERGYRAEHVDGDTPRRERRDLIVALANGDIDILTNCALISEGLDVPGVEAAILLRPTKSLALYLQMVGRALRPGKPMAYILDHAGNALRHGLPSARRRWSLHGREQQDAAAEGLRRCPECGALNERDAEYCANCEAELQRQQRPPRIAVAAPRLAEALEAPRDDDELQRMTLHGALRWAADENGRLRTDRLQRIAHARGYAAGWVWHNTGKSFDEAWATVQLWRERQLARE